MYSELSPSQDRWFRFRMAWKRRRYRARAIAKAGELRRLKCGHWGRGAILLFCTIRNEADRIDWFLHHYRGLGVDHFCFVDNGSDDGTLDTLLAQPDSSVWSTQGQLPRVALRRGLAELADAGATRAGIGAWSPMPMNC